MYLKYQLLDTKTSGVEKLLEYKSNAEHFDECVCFFFQSIYDISFEFFISNRMVSVHHVIIIFNFLYDMSLLEYKIIFSE